MAKESAYFDLKNLEDKHDTKKIKNGIEELPGIISVSVGNKRVCVDFDSTGTSQSKIQKQLSELGYDVTSSSLEEHTM